MSEAPSYYKDMLAELERDREEINAAINFVRKKLGMPPASHGPAEPQQKAQNGHTGGPAAVTTELSPEVKPDTFFGLKVPDAIKLYLNMTKRPARASVITRALISGGLQSTSTNFPANVQTALTRMKGEVVKVPNGWGLIEWYPGRSFDKAKPKKSGGDESAD